MTKTLCCAETADLQIYWYARLTMQWTTATEFLFYDATW